MGRRRNLMMITTMFAMVWLLLLIFCNASGTERTYVTTAKGQMLVDRHVAYISPNSYGDPLRFSRLAGNILRFFKTNCNMKLLWSRITMEQRDKLSSSTSLDQDFLSRRILRRKPPPTLYPPPGVSPHHRGVPAPSPGPIAFY